MKRLGAPVARLYVCNCIALNAAGICFAVLVAAACVINTVSIMAEAENVRGIAAACDVQACRRAANNIMSHRA